MSEYYHIETGYKRLSQGGYKPEYKLSIPKSQNQHRSKRLQSRLEVTIAQLKLKYSLWALCLSIHFPTYQSKYIQYYRRHQKRNSK